MDGTDKLLFCCNILGIFWLTVCLDCPDSEIQLLSYTYRQGHFLRPVMHIKGTSLMELVGIFYFILLEEIKIWHVKNLNTLPCSLVPFFQPPE